MMWAQLRLLWLLLNAALLLLCLWGLQGCAPAGLTRNWRPCTTLLVAVAPESALPDEVLADAVNYWNDLSYRLGEELPFLLLPDSESYGETPGFVRVSLAAEPVSFAGQSQTWRVKDRQGRLGCATRAELRIAADTLAYTSGQLESVLRHELGHILGYGHSTNPFSVMFPVLQDATFGHPLDLTEDDLPKLQRRTP